MISLEDYNAYCASLPATHSVVQWGGAHVWKVGTKVFAIGGWADGEDLAVTFKCSPESYDILKEQDGLRPAPYLAARGMKWIQMYEDGAFSEDDLKLYLKESHRLAALNLTKKKREELGLLGS